MNNAILYGIKNSVSNFANDVTFISLFAVFTLITVFLAVWAINVSIKRKIGTTWTKRIFGITAIIVFVGIALRIMLSFLVTGNRQEFGAIAGADGAVWKIIEDGFSGYYASSPENMIYPFSLYLYSIFAAFGSWFGVNSASVSASFFIKLPLIIADLCSIVLLYKIAKKYFNDITAAAVACLYAICPIFIFTSSVWGSLYAILAFFLLLTFYFVVQKKFLLMTVSYSLALLIAREAIFLLPVIAVFSIYNVVKAVNRIKVDGKKKRMSFSQLFLSPEKGVAIRIPLYFVCSLLGMYLLCLPLIVKDYNANFFVFINEFFIGGLGKADYYGYNSLSLYNIFNMNGSLFNDSFAVWFVILFMAIVTALTVIFYFSRKNRANLVMLGGFVYMTLSIFFVNFRELTAIPVLSLILLSFLFVKDKRLLHVFAICAIATVINASVVMASAGYLNNTVIEYASSSLLVTSVGKAINIACSVVNILGYLYFTFALMDISMNFNRKLFGGQDSLNPLYAAKEWFVK